MHENELAAEAKARQMLAIINRGFRNEHHWRVWFHKHRADINALSAALRRDVLLAYDQASHIAFSAASSASAPKEPSK